MNFVLWGIGLNGKNILKFLKSKKISAIIDSNPELQNTYYNDIPIISFNEYKEKYFSHLIVITPTQYRGIVEFLEKEGIYHYLILEECPGDIKYPRKLQQLEDIPLKIDKDKVIYVYGNIFYSFILYDYLLDDGCSEVYLKFTQSCDPRLKEKVLEFYPNIKLDGESYNLDNSQFILTSREAVLEANAVLEKEKSLNIYNLSDLIEDNFNPAIVQFRDLHKGKRCFIVATGPSLKIEDLDCLYKNNEICISMNGIFAAFDQTEWRPDYYVASDAKVIEANEYDIKNSNLKYKFVSDYYLQFWQGVLPDNIFRYHVDREYFMGGYPEFTEDFSRKAYEGFTVTYTCLQLAAYMGFTEVYLLGVDFNYSSNMAGKENYFSEKYLKTGCKVGSFFKEETYNAYVTAKRYANEHGIEIYNATRGGKLEAFPRICFDSLF